MKSLYNLRNSLSGAFLTLVCAIAFSALTFGQITIGTGTSTQRYPLGAYFGYERSASLYTAAEVTMGGGITKLAWYATAARTATTVPMKIYLKETSSTTFTAGTWADMITGATLVYDASNTSITANAWNEFTLSSTYSYGGSNNLLVLVEANYGGTGTSPSTGAAVRYSTAASQHEYWQADNSAPTTSGSVTSSRPNIQITISQSPMAFASATTEQASTSSALVGTSNSEVVRLNVITTGTLTPFDLTSVTFNTTGTTSVSDITNARVYYTTTSVFSTATQFGSTIANPSGALTFTGTKTLGGGNNYFWLAYDISGSATEYNVVDGTCTQFITSEVKTTRTPTVTDPAGSRSIRSVMNGIYTINPDGSGSRNYTTFTAAVSDLNLLGISAPVTFNVAAGKTFSQAPLTISATGTVTNTITFQKDGAGANPVLNVTGTSGTSDAAFTFSGADYITFNGLNILDAGTSSSNYTEYGIWFSAASAANGCQYNTIKNCVIDLTKANTSSKGVYMTASSPSSAAGVNNNNKFYNNTVQDAYSAYYFSGSSTYYNDGNEIGIDGGTSLIDNIGGSSSAVYAVYVPYETNFKLFNTTLSNITASTSIYVVYNGLGGSATHKVYNNIFSNVTGSSTSSSVYGLYYTSGTTYEIYGNEFRTFSAPYSVYPVYVSSGTTISIYKNKIYDITYSGTSTLIAYGMYLGGGTNLYVYNNFVYDIKAPAATSSTTGANVRAISLTGGTNAYVYNNSVLLNYTATGTTNQSAGLYVGTSPTLELKNNIIVNKCNMTTGTRAVAFYKTTTSLTNFGTGSNNNLYYAGVPGAKSLIFYDGTNSDQTIASYKTRMATRDQGAISEDPPFTSVAEAINLHMRTDVATQAESGGLRVTTPVAVATDIDGDIRHGETGYSGTGTAPDLGADEFNGVPNDITPPVISYTALENTTSTSARSFSVTVTDASGVPTSGIGLPVLKWKINSGGSWNSVQATHGGGDTYNFQLGAGVILGDSVYYYVLAQDNATIPNVAAYPAGGASGFTANPPAAATAPTSPSRYVIVPGISGTFTVGSGGNYATITAAVNDIASKMVTGAIRLNLIDATYDAEAYPIVIPQFSGVSATNTVTITPAAGNTVTLNANNTSAVFKLNGADYIIIDGSNSGGTSKNMTLINYNATSSVIWFASLGANAGATNNIVKNCTIKGGSVTGTGAYGISFSGSTLTTAGEHNDYNTIQNNTFLKAYYPLYVLGSSAGVVNDLLVTQNTVGADADTNYTGKYGMYFTQVNNSSITQNTVFNQISSTITNPSGIYAGASVTNSSFTRNKIYGIKYTGTTGYGGKAIDLNTANSSSALTVANNVMYDISGDGYSGTSDNICGIRIGSGGGYNIYYNSVNLFGSISRSSATTDISGALFVLSGSANLDIRNNVFVNSLENTSGVSTAYAVYSLSANTAYTTINYNDYFASGAEGVLGYLGSNCATLSAWQTATTKDANSLAADPQFNGNTNLIPQATSPILNMGTPIAGVTTDYLGNTRSLTTPTMGGYEGSVDISGPAISFTDLGNTTSTLNRSFTNVTVTDPSGVNGTSGTRPRVYYKRSTDANAWNDNTSSTDGWKWVEASGSTSPFSFTIDYAKLNGGTGVAQGNTVQYFVVAQDNQPAPYVSIQSGSFAANPSSVALTGTAFPVGGTIKSYAISVSLSGTVTVGSGGNYATLTGAGGFFSTINNGVVTGNVTVNIISDLTEDGTNALNQWAEEPVSSNFTVTIQPSAAANRTVSGSYAGGLIRLNGADRVTFDGRYGGGGKYLTITNTATAGTIAAIQLISGARHNTIRDCNISTGSLTLTTSYGIAMGGATVATTGADNDSNYVVNNTITKAYVGLWAQGSATANPGLMDYLQITGNTFGSDDAASYLGHDGIMLANASGPLISQNTIYNLTTGTTPAAVTCTTGVVSGTITRNKIHNISYVGTAGYGGRGIYISTANASSSLLLANNVIYNIGGDGYTSFSNSSMVGIYLDGTTGGVSLYYNSIHLYGDFSRSGATLTAAMLLNTSTITAVDMRDNIFANNLNNTGSTTAKNYAIYSASANTAFTAINYNDYYVSGSQGVLGYLSIDQTSLTSWKLATGQDVNSISADPQFNANTNLQPLTGSPVLAAGTPVSVTVDYAGNTRSGSTPSIGAYEYGGDGAPPVITYTALSSTQLTSNRTLTNVTITDALTGVNTTGGTKPRIYYKKSTDNNVFGGNTSADNGWKWTETADNASPFSFTINYAIINGGSVTTDNIIQYFVVAQDLNTPIPNVASNPSTGFTATSVSVVTAAPNTPNQYRIVGPPLSGDYTIGLLAFNKATGRNVVPAKISRTVTKRIPVSAPITADKDEAEFHSKEIEQVSPEFKAHSVAIHYEDVQVTEEITVLTENGQVLEHHPFIDSKLNANDGPASGTVAGENDNIEGVYSTITAAVAALNERGVSGPVRLLLNDTTYPSETFPITFDFTSAGSPPSGTNTVTLKPNTGVTATVNGSSATAIFKLNGADHVIFDGSNTVGGSSRNLTIENTITTAGTSAVLWLSSPTASDGATNNTIKNCIIQGAAMTVSTVLKGIGLGGATNPDVLALAQNSGNTIQNNKITKAQYAIDVLGTSASIMDSNITIANNDCGSAASGDGFYNGGIYLESVKNSVVSGNTVRNIVSAATVDMFGIWTANCKQVSVMNNKVSEVSGTNTSTYKNYGIRNSGTTYNTSANPSQNLFANNFVSGITSVGTSSYYNCMGILTTGGYGNKFYHNTVYLAGSIAGASGGGTTSASACFANGHTLTTAPVDSATDVRNNIFHMAGTSGGSSMYAFAVVSTQAASAYAANTADYNLLYTSVSSPMTGYTGYMGTTGYSTLAAWKTATGKDAHSKTAAVTYAGAPDLHLSGGSVGDKNLAGTPLSVTTDIDGQTRNTYAPYMGADEIPGSPLALGLNLTAYIEGFYEPAAKAMISDTMKVYLCSSSYYARIDSATAVLSTSGTGTFAFTGNSRIDSSYYIVLKHRNSIETWSAMPQTFPSGERAYNFTSTAGQAYGSNMTLKGTKYCVYGGDVNQDGIVDFSDILLIDNDQFNFVGGYVLTDITGDNFVDFSDLSICDNNQFNFISVVSPLTNQRPAVIKQLDTKPVIRRSSSGE